ncbi:MAG TPA: hypothetical protein VK604_01540 [Bryobacteraceae bacterium]|nr:hypothetical protein [Bryobacteraceae bacterium]
MFRGKTNATETDGTEALWIRDLSRIETSYGRLVYLAGLRNQDTGRYEHYASTAGSPSSLIASRTLKRIHETIFKDWVSFPLERKKADIEFYIAAIDHVDRAGLIDAWLRLRPYLNLVPATIQGPERQRHISDFEAILGLLKNVYGVSSLDLSA